MRWEGEGRTQWDKSRSPRETANRLDHLPTSPHGVVSSCSVSLLSPFHYETPPAVRNGRWVIETEPGSRVLSPSSHSTLLHPSLRSGLGVNVENGEDPRVRWGEGKTRPRKWPPGYIPIPFTSLTHLIPLPFTLSSFFLQSSRHERGTSEWRGDGRRQGDKVTSDRTRPPIISLMSLLFPRVGSSFPLPSSSTCLSSL